jgi:multidrug efflux pump subunit AcrB
MFFVYDRTPPCAHGLRPKDLSSRFRRYECAIRNARFVWTQLITVPGAIVPLPYRGKQRQVMINMDHNLMQARNVSPTDVLNAVNA